VAHASRTAQVHFPVKPLFSGNVDGPYNHCRRRLEHNPNAESTVDSDGRSDPIDVAESGRVARCFRVVLNATRRAPSSRLFPCLQGMRACCYHAVPEHRLLAVPWLFLSRGPAGIARL
jgi:hypothetical protein